MFDDVFFNYIIIFKLNIVLYLFPQLSVISPRPLWFALTWGSSVLDTYDVATMCLRATGLRFFQICHCVELNNIVEAMMLLNPYDDRKVSLPRLHGNGDLDIVRASYTRRKANVTEA